MKKLLLTSALVASFASSAFAHAGPTVTLGGSIDTQLGVVKEKSGFATDQTTSANKLHRAVIVNDTSLHVKADGKAGNGLKYGGMVEMGTDTSNSKVANLNSNGNNTGNFESNARKTMVYVESMFGRMEAGSTEGVVNSMSVNGMNVARADGAQDWKYFVNPSIKPGTTVATMQPIANNFIINPVLPSNYDTRAEANSAKVNWMSPNYMGVRVGLTYMPDIEQHGTASLTRIAKKNSVNLNTTGGYRDVFSGGLHYAGKVSHVGLKASLLGETGKAKNAASLPSAAGNRHDLRAWEIGASAHYMGFTLAASYGDWGRSGTLKNDGGKKTSNYWTVGGSYEHGALGASVTYMQSKRGRVQDNMTNTTAQITGGLKKSKEASALSFGVDYKLAPGFMPYAAVTAFKLQEKNAPTRNNKNDGHVFIAGTKLSF